MELVDTHCHLDVAAFDADREQVLARAREAGVGRVVVPAIDAEHWRGVIDLCASHAGLYPALGLHPMFMSCHRDAHVPALMDAIDRYRPVAVGEIGLDFYQADADRAQQQALFAAQLGVAADSRLPVILHVRKAHDVVLKMLRQQRVVGGIVHAFNGSWQQAQQYLQMDFKLGFGGMLTYRRSRKLRALAAQLPLQAIVLETDAPDMTVASHRGERNSPEYLPECLLALADVRGDEPAALARATCANARHVLTLT